MAAGGPLPAQGGQPLGLNQLLSQRKEHLLFLVEVAADEFKGAKEALPRREERGSILYVDQSGLDLIVLATQHWQWPGLLAQVRDEFGEEERIFQVSVGIERRGQQHRKRADLRQALRRWHGLFQARAHRAQRCMLAQEQPEN